MVVESIFLDKTTNGTYIFFYTRAKDLAKANQVVQASKNPVHLEALEMITETWETAVPLEVLFDADLIEP